MRRVLPNIKVMRTKPEFLSYLATHPDVRAVRVEGLGREMEKKGQVSSKERWRTIHRGPSPGGKFWALTSEMPSYQYTGMPESLEGVRKSKAKILVSPLKEFIERHKEVYIPTDIYPIYPEHWEKVTSTQELERIKPPELYAIGYKGKRNPYTRIKHISSPREYYAAPGVSRPGIAFWRRGESPRVGTAVVSSYSGLAHEMGHAARLGHLPWEERISRVDTPEKRMEEEIAAWRIGTKMFPGRHSKEARKALSAYVVNLPESIREKYKDIVDRYTLPGLKYKRARNPLRLLYVPPPTKQELDDRAKVYDWDRSKIRGQKTILKEWESQAQEIVNKLARHDGIRPPKVEVSPNAETWINGDMSGGMYIPSKQKIAMGSTTILVDLMGRISPIKSCRYPLHTLLHEYRHHYQYETLGKAKADEIYEKEGSVGHEGHSLERDADKFADKTCQNIRSIT